MRFLNRSKVRDFKTCLPCFEVWARTSNGEGLRATSLLKGSVQIINENKLTVFTALYSAWDCIHRKIPRLRKLFQVGYVHSSLLSVWTLHCFRSFICIWPPTSKEMVCKKHFTCMGWALIVTLHDLNISTCYKMYNIIYYFLAISSQYREKKANFQKSFEDIAEHLFNQK